MKYVKNSAKKIIDEPAPESNGSPPKSAPAARQPPRKVVAPPNTKRVLHSTKAAAPRLDLTVTALRARLQEAAQRGADGSIEAHLGAGVVGYKLGHHWRIWIPTH